MKRVWIVEVGEGEYSNVVLVADSPEVAAMALKERHIQEEVDEESLPYHAAWGDLVRTGSGFEVRQVVLPGNNNPVEIVYRLSQSDYVVGKGAD